MSYDRTRVRELFSLQWLVGPRLRIVLRDPGSPAAIPDDPALVRFFDITRKGDSARVLTTKRAKAES